MSDRDDPDGKCGIAFPEHIGDSPRQQPFLAVREQLRPALLSVLLLTLFGDFEPGTPLSSALRRALLLTMASVFASVAIISRNVWTQVQPMLPTTPAAIGAAAVRPRQ